MRAATLVAGLAVLLAACGATVSTPSPTSEATATPSAIESAAPPEAIGPARICAVGPDGPMPPISCTEAIGQALLALGPDARAVQAAWFREGAPCPPNARCVAPPPGSVYVVVRLEDGRIRFVRLVVADGDVIVGEPEDPTFDLWPRSGEAIPPVGRPDVGPGAPAEVAEREAFPLCGEERVGVFDRRAGRTCFLGAVQDGRPAELASQEAGADFDAVVVLYRFAGRGPLFVYRSATEAGPGWVRSDCAMGLPVEDMPGDDEFVFLIHECLSTELS